MKLKSSLEAARECLDALENARYKTRLFIQSLKAIGIWTPYLPINASLSHLALTCKQLAREIEASKE